MDLDPLDVVPHAEAAPARPVGVASVPRVDDVGGRHGPDPAAGRLEVACVWIAGKYGRVVGALAVIPVAGFVGWVFSEIGSLQHAILRGLTLFVVSFLALHLILGLGLLMHKGVRGRRARRVEREARAASIRHNAPTRKAIESAYRPLTEHDYPGAGRTFDVTATAFLFILCAVATIGAFGLWEAASDGGVALFLAFSLSLATLGGDLWLVMRLRRVTREARLFFRWALETARRGLPHLPSGGSGTAAMSPTFRPYGWKADADSAAAKP